MDAAELATELEQMLNEGRVSQLLGEWLARNGTVVVDALRMADNMVMIPEIDLSDMVKFVRQQRAK